MSTPPRPEQPDQPARKRVTLSKLAEMRALGEPIVMITAYDHPSALVVEEAGVDVVLVAVAARVGATRLIDNSLIDLTAQVATP